MNKDEWWPCTELTLQGNLTIAGFAQKTWTAKPGVCEIHLHSKSGMARIDWNHSSVVVSPAVMQHATLDVLEQAMREHQTRHRTFHDTRPRVETPSGLDVAVAPLEDTKVSQPSRADEILAEMGDDKPLTVRRRGRKPKAD